MHYLNNNIMKNGLTECAGTKVLEFKEVNFEEL